MHALSLSLALALPLSLTVSDEAIVTWAMGLLGTGAFGIAAFFFKGVANELKALREELAKLRESFGGMQTRQALLERDATTDRERIARLEAHVLDRPHDGGRRSGDPHPTPAPAGG